MSHETDRITETDVYEDGVPNSSWYNRNGPGDEYKPTQKKVVTRYEHADILKYYSAYPLPDILRSQLDKPDIQPIISETGLPPVTLTLTPQNTVEIDNFWKEVSKLNVKKMKNEDEKPNVYRPKHSNAQPASIDHQPSYLVSHAKRPVAMDSNNWRARPTTQPAPVQEPVHTTRIPRPQYSKQQSSSSDEEEEQIDREKLKKQMKSDLKKITPTPESDTDEKAPLFTPVEVKIETKVPSTSSLQLQPEIKKEEIKPPVQKETMTGWYEPVEVSIPLTSNFPLNNQMWNKPAMPELRPNPQNPPTMPTIAAVPKKIERLEYFYRDPKNIERGPYQSDRMRSWFEAGYFTGDLKIRVNDGEYYLLSQIFPDAQRSFLVNPDLSRQYPPPSNPNPNPVRVIPNPPTWSDQIPPNPVWTEPRPEQPSWKHENQWGIKQTNVIPLSEIQKEEERKPPKQPVNNPPPVQRIPAPIPNATMWGDRISNPQPPQTLAEIQMYQQQQQQQQQRQDVYIPSPQRQMGWAISQQQHVAFNDLQMQEESNISILQQMQQNDPSKPVWSHSSLLPPQAKSLDDIQREEMERVKNTKGYQGSTLSDIVRNSASTKVVPRWGAAPTPAIKSLAELQQEEAERKNMASGLKNMIGVNQQVWAGSAQTPVYDMQSLQRDDAKATTMTPSPPQQSSTRWENPSVKNMSAELPRFNPPKNTTETDKKAVLWDNSIVNDDATMLDGEFGDWCRSQVKKITGHTDISLLVSCLTLDSSAKIREFIRDLYGSKPEVSNFATEFIQNKSKYQNQKKRSKK